MFHALFYKLTGAKSFRLKQKRPTGMMPYKLGAAKLILESLRRPMLVTSWDTDCHQRRTSPSSRSLQNASCPSDTCWVQDTFRLASTSTCKESPKVRVTKVSWKDGILAVKEHPTVTPKLTDFQVPSVMLSTQVKFGRVRKWLDRWETNLLLRWPRWWSAST